MPETEDFDEAMRLGLKPRALDPNRIAALPAMAPPTMPTGSGLNPATLDLGSGPINPRIAPMSPNSLPDPSDPKYNPGLRTGIRSRLAAAAIAGLGGLSSPELGLREANSYIHGPQDRAQEQYKEDRQHVLDINSQADVDAQRQEREAIANRQPQPRDPLHVAPGEMVQNPDGSFTQVGTPKEPAEKNPVHVAPGDYVQQDDGSFKQIGTPKLEKGNEPPRSLMYVPQPDGSLKVVEATPGASLPRGATSIAEAGKETTANDAKGAAQQYADDYLSSNKFTGAGDEALMEKYFELAKPSSGFRMTQPQIEMLTHAQDLMNSIVSKGKHLFSPEAPYFSDTLRKQIVDTMKNISKAGEEARGGGAQKSSGGSGIKITRDANGRIVGVE